MPTDKMSEQLFFIDTNPQEENEEDTNGKQKDVDKNHKKDKEHRKSFLEKDKQLKPLRDRNQKPRQIKRKEKLAEKEENLSKFLFGNLSKSDVLEKEKQFKVDISDQEDINETSSSSDESTDDEQKVIDGDEEKSVEVEEKSDEDEQESDDEDGEKSDNEDEHKADDEDEEKSVKDELKSLDEDDQQADESSSDDSDDDASEEEDNTTKEMMPKDTFGANLLLAGSTAAGRKRKAAWHDEADQQVLVKDVAGNYDRAPGNHGTKDTSTQLYSQAVKKKFTSLVGTPAWADLHKKDEAEEEMDSDDEFFQQTTSLIARSRSSQLQKGKLNIRAVTDMNAETKHQGAVIRSTDFHPTSTVGLIAGKSGTTSIVQIDGKNNPNIQTVNFKDFPIKTAKFSVNGEELIVGSPNHAHFFSFDMIAGKISEIPMPKKLNKVTNTQIFALSPDQRFIALMGRFGDVHLLSSKTKEYIGKLKMNNECRALTFSKSGSLLYTHGDRGEIYVWDMSSRTCRYKFVDDGCINGSAIEVNSNYLVSGSSEGVVNIYSLDKINRAVDKTPKPDKTILNLITRINELRFNPTGEILAMSSEMKEHAVKLLHFPSMTVFENFPKQQQIFRVNSVAFSPGGGYFSLGNNKGRALLYRLRHYKDF